MTAVRPAASVVDRLAGERFGRFFDWATVGPVSPAGVAARNAFLARVDESDHPAVQLRQEAHVLGDTRAVLGRFVGATGDHHIVFGRSVSALCSLVATSLAEGAQRPTVVLTDIEHPMTRLAWAAARRYRPGLEVRAVPPTATGLVDPDAVAAAVDERCVAVCTAHVSRMSGVVQPVAALARLARRAGAVLLVDGAQAAGRVPIDLPALECDGYLGSGQKSLLAGTGIAFLAAKTALLARLRPLTWSNSNARVAGPDTTDFLDGPGRFEPEPPDLATTFALHASVTEFLRLGMAEVQRRLTHTTAVLVEQMRTAGLPLRYPLTATNAGILSYDTTGCTTPADVLAGKLRHEGLAVKSAGQLLRISVHLPNNGAEIAELVHTIRRHL